ncbi:hypothetical protein Ga0080574_TMP3808 [Salipiger abyssi]|uniref:Uncharacterized protein n=2 Tax=Salipiger abyssi TaxID=1250539 RepID=A0A1P8UXL8_9RHOB|nr:hypothetical protein Ga0080574_TMP3808 [Salipiger abyssi]
MKNGHDAAYVLRVSDQLAARLEQLPEIAGPDWSASHAEFRKEQDALGLELTTRSDAQANIRKSFDGTSISMLGFRASSTSGLCGACRNWIRQVKAKVGSA